MSSTISARWLTGASAALLLSFAACADESAPVTKGDDDDESQTENDVQSDDQADDEAHDAGKQLDAGPRRDAGADARPPATSKPDAGSTTPPLAPAPDGGMMTGDAGPAPAPGSEVPAAATLPIAKPPAPQGCIDKVGPANQLVFESCGQNIVFNVSVPEVCNTKACGLIFDVHGFTMSGPIEETNTGIAALGRAEGYIVVQPSAPDASWNGETHDPVVVDFLKNAIEVWQVEKRRVHFTGFSQGGAMTYRMRCALADILASVAPVGMRGTACDASTKPLDTFWIIGKDDVFVSAEQAKQTYDSLIAAHKLTLDTVLAMGERFKWSRYKNSDGMVFEHLDHSFTSFPLGGHCFPGSNDAAGLYGCDEDAPFKHGRIVVDFFKAHPQR